MEVESGGGGESGDRLYTIGLDLNAPQHSFPHIPFNFSALMELAVRRTHSHCAQRQSARAHTHENKMSTHAQQHRAACEHVLVIHR